MAANYTFERSLSDSALEDVAATALKGLALINFGQTAQLRGH
jgi:hypothetical protein